ncbi:glycosyltransferase, partial [Citrobacter sp. VF227]
MKVLFATYPMAFHTPGGGEVQLLAYRKHLPAHGVDVTLMNTWEPRFLEHDVVHFFSCISGSYHLYHFVKRLGLPLVISASLW